MLLVHGLKTIYVYWWKAPVLLHHINDRDHFLSCVSVCIMVVVWFPVSNSGPHSRQSHSIYIRNRTVCSPKGHFTNFTHECHEELLLSLRKQLYDVSWRRELCQVWAVNPDDVIRVISTCSWRHPFFVFYQEACITNLGHRVWKILPPRFTRLGG